jgi:hypothetical protein
MFKSCGAGKKINAVDFVKKKIGLNLGVVILGK